MSELMRTHRVRLAEIYVPGRLAKTLDEGKVEALAEDILENGLKMPVQVRRDEERGRFVLVVGLHRLEAVRALGEDEIDALIVQAPKR